MLRPKVPEGVGQAELGREGIPGRGTGEARTEEVEGHLCGGERGERGGPSRPPGSPGVSLQVVGSHGGAPSTAGTPRGWFRKDPVLTSITGRGVFRSM